MWYNDYSEREKGGRERMCEVERIGYDTYYLVSVEEHCEVHLFECGVPAAQVAFKGTYDECVDYIVAQRPSAD